VPWSLYFPTGWFPLWYAEVDRTSASIPERVTSPFLIRNAQCEDEENASLLFFFTPSSFFPVFWNFSSCSPPLLPQGYLLSRQPSSPSRRAAFSSQPLVRLFSVPSWDLPQVSLEGRPRAVRLRSIFTQFCLLPLPCRDLPFFFVYFASGDRSTIVFPPPP